MTLPSYFPFMKKDVHLHPSSSEFHRFGPIVFEDFHKIKQLIFTALLFMETQNTAIFEDIRTFF